MILSASLTPVYHFMSGGRSYVIYPIHPTCISYFMCNYAKFDDHHNHNTTQLLATVSSVLCTLYRS